MRTRSVVWMGVAGLALGVATVLQARAICKGVPSGSAHKAAATQPVSSQAHLVAAEGRVVAYPGAEVKVAAERGGRLVSVRVEEGAVVQKGDLLAELDSVELRAALAEARAKVDESDAEIRLAELNQARRQNLVAQQVVAVADLDQSNRDLEIGRARRETAKAEAARLAAQLDKTRILAPISGTVVNRAVNRGETVATGDAIVTLADLARLRVEGEADEADAGALVPGASVEVTAEGYPGLRWPGRIEDVAHSVTLRKLKSQDPSRPTDTRVISVKVAFTEPNPLRLGTTVELAVLPNAEVAPPR